MSTSHRFVWYRVPKVGTRTIDSVIAGTDATEVSRRIRLRYVLGRYDDFYKFAFVRNPWDRLVSAWANKVRDHNYSQFGFDGTTHARMQDFSTFVRWVCDLDLEAADRHLRLQASLIDVGLVDFVGRMENFEHDLAVVCARVGLPSPQARVGATERDAYRSYYDDTTRERVGSAYAADIDRFGYEF